MSDYDRRSYRTAIVEGLRSKYKVLSGDEVDKIVNKIFEKESRENIECDTEKCFQDIAIAFQAELIASCTVVRKSGGYILNLQINNVLENENILSKSVPCEGCNEFKVINVLKSMAGGKVLGSALVGTVAPPSSGAESATWDVVKNSNDPNDIEEFLKAYPNSQFATAAKFKLKQLERNMTPEEKAKAKADEMVKNFKPKEKTEPPPEGMVLVKGGCYEMGDTFGDSDKIYRPNPNPEKPVHTVCLDDFFMDKYEVTQSDFQSVMGSNPSFFEGCSNCPVELVTWFKAKEYCEKVGKRLPTEAEWEYAARSGGKKEKYAGTNSSISIDSYAWYSSNSGSKTHHVGRKNPNGLGLYDMSGNVWEWVSDWYDENYYSNSPTDNPKGPDSGKYRVLRGGSWDRAPEYVQASTRIMMGLPDRGDIIYGFRCSQ
ncbi:MAG: formylglycine-generating enzyme family protein [Nitrospinota bacterium]